MCNDFRTIFSFVLCELRCFGDVWGLDKICGRREHSANPHLRSEMWGTRICGWDRGSGEAGYGDYADVVLLAEVLGGGG
jgi:hypothetical protein